MLLLLLLLLLTLGEEGSGWTMVLLLVIVLLLVVVPPVAACGSVTRLFKDGIGGRVGIGSTVVDTVGCVLLLVDAENKGVGLPAWENTIHPAKNEARLVMAIQTRSPIFIGFIMLFLWCGIE